VTWLYAWQWNDILNRPMDPLTEAEARQRHKHGELYTAYSVNQEGAISIAVEVRLESGYVGVWDFDKLGRRIWHRSLDRRGDRLFLSDSSTFEYGESIKRLRRSQAKKFFHRHLEPDGTGYERRRVKGDPMEERVDISLNPQEALAEYWVPVPDFGQYQGVCLAGINPQDLDKATRTTNDDHPSFPNSES
jgi:hypothetical protein